MALSSESSGALPKVLVMGVGSILMMDEGLGIRAVEELEKRYRFPENVELLDGGTSGIELLSYISGRDHLIIIDAIKSGNPPGTVLRVEGEDVPAQFRTRISPHQLGLSDLLAAATLTDEIPKHLVLFGIEPKEIVMAIGLSDEVRAGMDRLVEVVVDELRRLGCDVVSLLPHEISQTESVWGRM
jgi:hydrogenase maturation protease